jgi:outer membrane immunogenic protein
MKRFAACITPVALLMGSSALAADMALKAAPPASARVFSWTGWYVGLNAGGGWGRDALDNSFIPGACVGDSPAECANEFDLLNATLPAQFDVHPRGFIGGGQLGYNYQSGAFVAGIETDFQGTGLKGNDNTAASVVPANFPTALLSTVGTGSEKIDWFGTLRGRLGWAPTPPLLVYLTGGLAYGRVQTGASFSEQAFVGGVLNSSGSAAILQSDILAGWTAGGGLEWMLAPQWSVKGEYLYYDLGTASLNQTLVVVSAITPSSFLKDNIQSAANYRGNIVRIGVNYKFW